MQSYQVSDTTQFNCYVIGSGSLAQRCAEHLLAVGYCLRGIISTDEALRAWSKEQNITCYSDTHELLTLSPQPTIDYLFSIANEQILDARLLQLPCLSTINYHDSLLPHYAGIHATSWVLLAEEQVHSLSWHQMKAGIDAGSILIQIPVDIVTDETALSLNLKCHVVAFAGFKQLLTELSTQTSKQQTQNLSQRSYYSYAKKNLDNGAIDWGVDAPCSSFK